MNIHESAENYLEAILALGEKGPVRSIDVAQHLNFSKPSVSRAMTTKPPSRSRLMARLTLGLEKLRCWATSIERTGPFSPRARMASR